MTSSSYANGSNGSNGSNGVFTTTAPNDWSDASRPRILLTDSTPTFDTTILKHLHEEGFQTLYLPFPSPPTSSTLKSYSTALTQLTDQLETGEKYAIIAYDTAASYILTTHLFTPDPHLCATVAYSPTSLPPTPFPPQLNLTIHLPSSSPFGSAWARTYRYPNTSATFALPSSASYSAPESRVAYTRTLFTLHTGFNTLSARAPLLETLWDTHTALEFADRDPAATMQTMIAQPYVNHTPTMTGGIGAPDLTRFYTHFFIPQNPPDMQLRLLSRTVGVDRVVDEMFISFTHDREVSWMLPGIPATGKKVEIIVVAVVNLRGGLLCHEHIHWDQASVLVQIGLLDVGLVPAGFRTVVEAERDKVTRVPALGAEAARKVVDEHDGQSNLLIPGW